MIYDTVSEATMQVLFVHGLFACEFHVVFAATVAQDWAEDSAGYRKGDKGGEVEATHTDRTGAHLLVLTAGSVGSFPNGNASSSTSIAAQILALFSYSISTVSSNFRNVSARIKRR